LPNTRQQTSPRKRSGRKGIVLVLTLFFMMILGLLSVALFAVVPQDLRQTRAYQNDLDAHYAATAGIKEAVSFMSSTFNTATNATSGYSFANSWPTVPATGCGANDPFGVPASGYDFYLDTSSSAYSNPGAQPWNMSPMSSALVDPSPLTPAIGSQNTYFYPNMPVLRMNAGVIRLNGNWCVDVAIYPDKYTKPHAFYPIGGNLGNFPPAYCIVALAFQDFNGNGKVDASLGEHYTLRAKANVSVASFARYAYFEQTQNIGTPIVISTQGTGPNTPQYSGPYYTGGTPILKVDGGADYWAQQPSSTNTYTPAFTGTLTYAGTPPASQPGQSIGSVDFATLNGVKLNADGLGWAGGNMNSLLDGGLYTGTATAQRPYNDQNIPIATNYTRLITGGQSSIQNVPAINLPANSGSLALNAWGITEQATITSQSTIVGADKVYVNTQAAVSGAAAGGVFINGDVQQMVLQVLNASGNPIGDGTLSSAVPNNTNNGNTAIRVTMSNTYVASVGSGSTAKSNGDSNTYSTSSSDYSKSYFLSMSAGPKSYSQSLSQSYGPSYYSQYVSMSGERTSTPTFASFSNWNSTQTYQVPHESFGGGGGQQAAVTWYTPSYVTTPQSTSQTAPSYYNQPTSISAQETTSKSYTASGQTETNSNYSVFASGTYLSMTANSPTETNLSNTFTSNSGYAISTTYQPVALVIEANTVPMALSSSNPSLFSSNATFVFGPAASQTTSYLNLGLSQAAVFNQDHTNPNLFQVATMMMPKGKLNGAVQVQGNIGVGNPASPSATNQGGISGWNKEPRTIAAESDSWAIVSGTASQVSSAGKTLRIDGNIDSFGTPLGQSISGSYLYSNNLGLLASNVDVRVDNGNSVYATSTSTSNGYQVPVVASSNAMYLYAVVMAAGGTGTGGVGCSNLPALTSSPNADTAYLNLFGGILQGTPGTLLQGNYGWRQNYSYDAENALSPPPFFPTLNSFSVYNYLEERLGMTSFGGAGGTQ
jgi:Tfp pilus assembly protein PilX